ncbi:DNA translocase FtsK [Streptomyces sp. NBC_01361]|uniref:DNA translocase FtsK n=1 Tax=Streptomyces sp. NBC_01361 TaxID=2903838 RepID=UPI002E2FE7FE|nr:DNA translocase FtsK [Streptomyces sp. NBC_01361]
MTEIGISPETDSGSLDRKLLWQAAELLVATQLGSRSMLQRKLRIGWDQTGLVMDVMERLGVVGEDQGATAREVKIKLVEDLEPVYEALYGDGPAATVTMLPSARQTPATPVDFTKPPVPSAPTAPADTPETRTAPETDPEPEPEHDRAVEGTVYTADEWELRPDPEGDRPWINPALRTPEGRKARARYIGTQARRRARKAAARQRTVHGFVPRVFRGEKRVRAWVRGVEGAKARADLRLALATVAEADSAARWASVSVLHRAQKRGEAQKLQLEAGKQLAVAQATKKRAKRAVTFRAGITYVPLAAADLAALGFADVWGFLGALALNLAGASWMGRDVEVTEEQMEKLEQVEAGIPQEFTVGMTPRMFKEMVRQALTEDLKVTLSALRVDPYAWGFEIHVWLERMSPEKISAGLDLLEACLPGVRTGSILMQQSAQSRNYCVIRVPGPNPWQAVPELPYRAPKSVSTQAIHQAQIGGDMAGRSLALPMCRTNVNIVGASRSGKSTIVRAILDALTATNDQIIIGIDLGSAGSGFGGLRHAMHVVATTPAQARDALQWALDIGKGRPSLFTPLGMGENWVTSAKRPGIKVIVDEFPALVRESRKGYYDEELKRQVGWDLDGLLAELAITSSKSDVTEVIAGQGVTKEKIKDNTWLVELPVQVLAACDKDDVVQILGDGMLAQGWRADRLVPAMGDQLNDASVAYVMAGKAYCEPIPYRACYSPDGELLRRGKEREAAGLVDIDAESARFSRITLKQLMDASRETFAIGGDPQEAVPQLITLIRQVFEALGNPSGLRAEEIAAGLGEIDADRWDLVVFDGDPDEQVAARAAALKAAIKAVLAAAGKSWTTDSYRVPGVKGTVKGYCLRDLKKITGEDDSRP